MFGFRKPLDAYGMNRRNRDLVLLHNPPRAIALANDKIATKRALAKEGVPVPATIAEIRRHRDVAALLPILREQRHGFVCKPSHGSQGRGVTLFTRAIPGYVLPLHGEPWSEYDFTYYVCRLLSGEYTVGRPLDEVLVEEKINPDRGWIIADLAGPPDLRIIVHEGEPVFCMARLPTIASEGRANLHKGGVGLGIDLRTALSHHAIMKEKSVSHHPDSGNPLLGQRVEGLADCLAMAKACARAIPLGYMGVDIIRDRDRGPIVIEVNARPGLAIQLANSRGLASVLRPRRDSE
ncbi:MAG: sugar-transfer associated ATP-grasp domain-containing protein [Candidatus Sumerlaeia bacterium]|nr:sugar-transfer associated ATP-grasp domain-containing protein [Candidatus Sumerlaeia bacterium]